MGKTIMKNNTKHNTMLKTVKRNIGGWMLLFPTVFLFFVISWRPVFIGGIYSFFDMIGYEVGEFVGLENFRNVITDSLFLTSLVNTLKYVLWSLIFGFIPPIILALMINEAVHLRGTLKFAIYFPSIVPAIVTSMLWSLLYYPDASGLFNTLLVNLGFEPKQWLNNQSMAIPLIVIATSWNGFGGTAIMYLASLQGINRELYEAATIDGAGVFRRIWSITIPHMKGVLLLFLVRQIIGVFQIMEQPLTMTGGGPNNASVSLSLQGYRYAFVYGQIDNAMAMGVITFVLLLIMTIFYNYLDKRLGDEA